MYLLLIFILFLTACSSSDDAPFDTLSDRTTITPTPPPIKPAQRPLVAPTDVPKPVENLFDQHSLQTYLYAGEPQFLIDYPASWQVFEQADGVIFIDPDNRAGYGLFFSRSVDPLAAKDINAFAAQFVQDNFGDEENFEILAQDKDKIRFKGTDINLGSAISELSFFEHNEFVYFVLITVVEDHWAQGVGDLRGLTERLVFQPTPEPTPTTEGPPLWVLYGHPTQQFAFLYPDNWTLKEEAESVTVVSASQTFVFAVKVVAAGGAGQNMKLVEAFTQAELDKLAAQFEAFEALPLTAYQSGPATGYTADYLYQDETGLPVAGSIIVTGMDRKLYQISITAPASLYADALAWFFNPMMQSFRILPAE